MSVQIESRKKLTKIFTTILFTTFIIAGFQNCAAPRTPKPDSSENGLGSPTPTSAPSPSPFPTDIPKPVQLILPGGQSHGIYDASLAKDPLSNRVWMTYSVVNSSAIWPTQNPDVVATRLAYSDDQGSSWIDSTINLTSTKDVNVPINPPDNAGTWTNEVSSVTYDPGAPVNQKWKMMWYHYLILNNQRRLADHAWIALKMAASPEGLKDAPEIKLFSSFSYNSGNDILNGITGSPVGGPPAIKLDTEVSPELNNCVFTEPSILSRTDKILVSMLCVKPQASPLPTLHKIVILGCDQPCTMTSASNWKLMGVALDDTHASAIGFDQGYSAPHLFEQNGAMFLMATPVSTQPFNSYYNGCKIYKFSNLNSAILEFANGKPKDYFSLTSPTNSFMGACAYNPAAANSGVIYSEYFPSTNQKFRMFQSKRSLE